MSFKSGSDFEASFTYIDDVTKVLEKMIKMTMRTKKLK